ncbi:hypothetical protein [Wenyingzhuangia sp. 2_MG-2023]|uniref:hypothetical protein n=1 Tax=Wenyingzhuangia sp. 2_MG-2023 TaxID=3062639 RepID=UPI0026E3D9DD|nr:hypothetical protein [Wenyingzhuangia sp. 2_MG-2023]MDO6738933.1 hypothetical protein [Wenyingzhuangia sp. 2_MG-2023]
MKECFIIMPISNNENYDKGHFDRVYNHLIKPACEIAGFKPTRADEIINTNYIAIDIIKRIIKSDMAICDLSSQNPNVLYELGIRQAFNKPVTLIKDKATKRIFDIQGFRDFEYDENLRIDNVECEIESLSELIQNTYESQGTEINSLTTLLSLSPAKLDKNKQISAESELILNTLSVLEKKISNIENSNRHNKISSNVEESQLQIPDNVSEILTRQEILKLKIGDRIFHPKFGEGQILNTELIGSKKQALKGDIQFNVGIKRIILSLIKVRKIL